MLTIHVYTNNNLTGSDHKATWLEALTLAYAVVEGLPFKAVHIFPTGVTGKLYIARHDDQFRRYEDGKPWVGVQDAAERAVRKFGGQ